MTIELVGHMLVFDKQEGQGYDIDLVIINGKERIIADVIYEDDL